MNRKKKKKRIQIACKVDSKLPLQIRYPKDFTEADSCSGLNCDLESTPAKEKFFLASLVFMNVSFPLHL